MDKLQKLCLNKRSVERKMGFPMKPPLLNMPWRLNLDQKNIDKNKKTHELINHFAPITGI